MDSNLLQDTKQLQLIRERQCSCTEDHLYNTNPLRQLINWPSLTSEVVGESLINLS
jgi:hypothetical protein